MKHFKTLSARTLAFSIIVTIVIAIFVVRHNYKTANLISDFYSGMIGQSLDSLLYASEISESDIIMSNYELSQKDFLTMAEKVNSFQKTEYYSYTPSRSVQFVYPYDEYKHMIGTNGFFKPEESHLSQIAAASNEIIAYTYRDTYNKKEWLIVKNPIIVKNANRSEDFLGFLTLAFNIDDITSNTKLTTLEELGYNYSLSVLENDTEVVVQQTPMIGDIFSIQKEIFVGGSTFVFTLYIPFLSVVNPVLLILTFFSLRFFYYAYIQLKQRKALSKQQMEYELYTDSLTGAYSRQKLETILDEKTQATLIYVTLPDLKKVNEDHGRNIGDGLLVAYTKRLQYNIKNAFVVRLGGGEFVVVLEDETSLQARTTVTERIQALSSQPFSISGVIINIQAKIGYAIYPEDSLSFAKLLSIASDRQEEGVKKGKKK